MKKRKVKKSNFCSTFDGCWCCIFLLLKTNDDDIEKWKSRVSKMNKKTRDFQVTDDSNKKKTFYRSTAFHAPIGKKNWVSGRESQHDAVNGSWAHRIHVARLFLVALIDCQLFTVLIFPDLYANEDEANVKFNRKQQQWNYQRLRTSARHKRVTFGEIESRNAENVKCVR